MLSFVVHYSGKFFSVKAFWMPRNSFIVKHFSLDKNFARMVEQYP